MEDELFSERYLISFCRGSIYISRVMRFLFDRLIEGRKRTATREKDVRGGTRHSLP